MASLINEAKRMQHLAGILNESQLNEVEGKDLNSYGKVLFDRLKKNGFDPKFVKSSGEFNNLSKIVKDKKDAKLAAVLYDDMGNPGDGYIMVATNEGNHDEIGKMLDSIKFELPDGGKHFEDSAWTWQINGSSFAKKPQAESQLDEVETKDVKIGGSYIASLDAVGSKSEPDSEKRINVRVKVLGPEYEEKPDTGFFRVEALENAQFTDPYNKLEYGYQKGGAYVVHAKYLKPVGTNESLDNLDEIVNTVLEKLRGKEEVNELFGLFGGSKEKKSAPKVLRVYWKLEEGALETVGSGSGVYYPNTPKGKKDFELWSNSLRQMRDNASRSNNPNQKFNCIKLKSPKVTDVYLTTKEVPYEKGMKVYTDTPDSICGPENDIRFYSHEDIINGKMK